MLLHRLKEYADQRLNLPPTLYRIKPVRYVIELHSSGALLNPEPTDTAEPGNRQNRRGIERLAPEVQRASGIKPLLLADKADYTLGYVGSDGKPERVAACHEAFLDLLNRCASVTRAPEVAAVQAFLRNNPLERLRLPEGFDPGATITFRVDGTFVTDLPAVQAFWADENDPASKGASVMTCLVCGEQRPVLDRLQAKVRGVPGGQLSGTAIISANAEAFESYGLEASLIAPTCANCGERFTQAINHLLGADESRMRLGGMAFVYWTRKKVDIDFLSFFNDPQPEQVGTLIGAFRSGRRVPEVDDTAFFATVLSGSGGRTVVRDWIDTTVGEVKRHLARWFLRQEIVDAYGVPALPLKLYALAAATARDPQKDLGPPTPRSLLHAALTGTPLPAGLLAQAVRRTQVEQDVTRPRAALIKLGLIGQGVIQEDTMAQLDTDHPSPAYRCGRLLAVLEQVQQAALGDVNATIVDRFYGTASTAPASVFPSLIKNAKNHLHRLRRDNPGAHYRLQERLEEVMPEATGFPKVLTLADQGLFALGYYHQRAFDRAQARAAAAARRQGAADTQPAPTP
ncbi:MAG: type I-C CRISPR-associated protein Cas8c/Csd1 [Chloroflexi bacterium]|nr:type I-C CRISPR-associated protein Cas8c/Csd1 [Chloroflexota bacterium]